MAIKQGSLHNEDKYIEYLDTYNKDTDMNNYFVYTMDNMDKFDLDFVEAEILKHKPDMVLIDSFELLSHVGRGNDRENMGKTSKRLRKLFAKHRVVGLVFNQVSGATKRENTEDTDLGEKVPKPASLSQYSSTIEKIQDASLVLNYDYVEGRGKIVVAKARKDCIGFELDLTVNYNMGYINETTTEETSWDF